MIDGKKLIEWLLGKKYITVDENSTEMTEEFEKKHQWEVSRNCFINKVVKYIEKQPKVGEWIPCSERLPNKEKSNEVLVTYYNSETKEMRVDIECYFHGVWVRTLGFNEYRTAWQPLPQPYREKVE